MDICLIHISLKRVSVNDITVTVGQFSLIYDDAEENTILAQIVHIHPEFNADTYANDIALIEVINYHLVFH